MYTLNEREKELAKIIVDCAYQVHKHFGPGLLEKIYELCFCQELASRGIKFKRQVTYPIHYDDLVFEEGIRIDVVVEDLIICEFKAVDIVNPVWEAQVLSQLKLTGLNVGFLINFNAPTISKGIRRYCRKL